MPWSAVKTEGIVLRVDKAREADRRYRALTPTLGKIEFIGRGAQKGKAKLAAHLEPFAIVDLEIIKGRRSTTVISVERRHWFRSIAEDLDKRLLASASMNLLDRYTYELEQDESLYSELLAWLAFLDSHLTLRPARSTFLLGGFLLRILTRLGYDVQLTECIGCKNDLLPLSYRWHAGKGGLVCSDCIQSEPQEWFSARGLDEEIVKLMRFARDREYQDLLKPALKGEQVEEFAKLVQDLLFYHLPHRNDIPFWAGVMADYQLELPENPL